MYLCSDGQYLILRTFKFRLYLLSMKDMKDSR